MHIKKASNGKKKIVMSRREWEAIGRRFKKAYYEDDDYYHQDYGHGGGDPGYDPEDWVYGLSADEVALLKKYRDSGHLVKQEVDEVLAESAQIKDRIKKEVESTKFRGAYPEDLDTSAFGEKAHRLIESVNAWEQEESSLKKKIQMLLEEFDYDSGKIESALQNAEDNADAVNEQEDWIADAMPGAYEDAQSLHNDRLGSARQKAMELQRAMKLLDSLKGRFGEVNRAK